LNSVPGLPEKIVLASGNRGKLREMRRILGEFGIAVVSQSDFGVDDADETGTTFVENALIKARHAAAATGLPAIADDSGLAVDALDGRPGVHSARYAGPGATDDANIDRLLAARGKRTPRDFHWELGRILWDHCGMTRNADGLREAADRIRTLRDEFWEDVHVAGSGEDLNQHLEYAGRVADYFELGELIALDAYNRRESCGCHLREDHQSEDGEAVRDDENFSHVAAWEYTGDLSKPRMHREKLHFENVHLAVRNYK